MIGDFDEPVMVGVVWSCHDSDSRGLGAEEATVDARPRSSGFDNTYWSDYVARSMANGTGKERRRGGEISNYGWLGLTTEQLSVLTSHDWLLSL